jgi:fatty acid desaturase
MQQPRTIPAEFIQRDDRRAWIYTAANAVVVVGAGSVAWHIDAWWAYLAAFILVGARGQACYVLQHEAMHNLLFENRKTNELVGILLSGLVGTQFYMARRMHMEHHRLVGQPGDPNEIHHDVTHRPPGLGVLLFFLSQLLGGRLVSLVKRLFMVGLQVIRQALGISKGAAAMPTASLSSKARTDLIALFAIQVAIMAVITLASSFWMYVLLYVLPLSTLTAFFETLRSFSEHVLPGAPPRSVAETNRRFYMDAGPVERFFVSQFDFHFHHVHHLYPNVPTFNVRRLHGWLADQDPSFGETFETRPGYVGVAWRYFANRPFPGAGTGYPFSAAGIDSGVQKSPV